MALGVRRLLDTAVRCELIPDAEPWSRTLVIG
jgi:hypothetical protein